jgi:S1-C subfamily serine protease
VKRYRVLLGILTVSVVLALGGCGLLLDGLDEGLDGNGDGGRPPGLDQPLQTAPPLTVAPTATAAPGIATPGGGGQGVAGASQPVGALADVQGQIEAIYAAAAPAVVHITSRAFATDWLNQAMPQEGTGSGFLFDDQGHIATNYHVVADADEITVAMADGSVYPAVVVGEDPSTDLAVIRVQAVNLPRPLPLADSDRLRVGQVVLAIGNPFGLDLSMTMGIISSLGRVIETPNARFVGEAIQTDAPINPGNSGGPLLDIEGRVIGVNSQIISPSRASAGVGFAVSSNTVRRVVPQLIAEGAFPHPWIGVTMLTLTPERVSALNAAGADIQAEEGVMILDVVQGSPADVAGLRGGQDTVQIQGTRIPVGGDVIIRLNTQPVASDRDLVVYLDTQTAVGQEVTVRFLRGAEEMSTTVLLAQRPLE